MSRTSETLPRALRFAFVALVTAAMLALTFEHAARGAAGLATAAVYAVTVGFGLEFVRAEWGGLSGRRDTRPSRS